MWKILLFILALPISSYSLPTTVSLDSKPSLGLFSGIVNNILNNLGFNQPYIPPKSLEEIKMILSTEGDGLSSIVINKVLTTIKCAREENLDYNNILTIIDYSLPSSKKRLWIFDLQQGKLLFHTYVSHGIKSGVLLTNNFSNKDNSKASSIGVYKTDKPYMGRHGLSLQLDGLDTGFNDNASRRAVVMHGGWYVEEEFIKKYGRAGRSWGCPAIPDHLTSLIINTIKDKSMFVMYYPSDTWFAQSKFLKCDKSNTGSNEMLLQTAANHLFHENDTRDDILLVNSKNFKRTDEAPVVAMEVNLYEQTFHTRPPLERMLRRQINNSEYIALSNSEFNSIIVKNTPENSVALSGIRFIKPSVVMVKGYYETQMTPMEMGKIKEVKLNLPSIKNKQAISHYTVYFDTRPIVSLTSSSQFIRWLGL